jgi:RNA polymerase sigma-54 factor
MALSQAMQQKMLQKLLPQQIQLMKLLQVPTANLEQRIKEEIEENPALELIEENLEDITDDPKDEFDTSDEEDFDLDGSADEYENLDVSEYVSDEDDIADYKLKDENYPEFDDKNALPVKNDISFNEALLSQLALINLSQQQINIAEQIIGSLDDDGYLRRETISIIDDLAFRQNIITNQDEVNFLINQIQQFEPAGIAARNLQECLLLQLQRKQADGQDVTIAIRVIKSFFDEFVKKHYQKILNGLGINNNQLKEAENIIVKLNPKPGALVGESTKIDSYIIPDFYVFNNNGELELTLNSKNAPELKISTDYKEMLTEYSKGSKKNKQQNEAVLFIKQKIDSAKWFIEAIMQRQQTLLSTMTEIMNYQKAFFLTGDIAQMRPLILKYIAEKTGYDISTISRVASSKYVATEFGTFKLKYFFGVGIETESGEEASTKEIKNLLDTLISQENKMQPLNDERLAELLLEKGFNIARRTVAKYREQLNLPVARLRKKL